MTPADFRQARRLLGWTIAEVATASNTYYHVVYNYEKSGRTTQPLSPAARTVQLAMIQAAFELAGIEFTIGDGPTVKLRPKAFAVRGLTPAQCEAARGLLGWSRERLGAFSETTASMLEKFERGGRMPQPSRGNPQIDRIAAIRTALEAAGVEFIQENGGGVGVRLRKGAA